MNHQPSLGKGHGGNSKLPAPVEITRTKRGALMTLGIQPGSRAYLLGRCTILVSPPFDGQGWHMSISHEQRYPTWDEVCAAWYGLVPDADTRSAAMILPPKADYINIHNFCFQVHEEIKS